MTERDADRMESQGTLSQIFDETSARARALRGALDGWPCQRGCDHCCRNLSRSPEINSVEWRRLSRGIEGLDASTRNAARARLQDAEAAPEGQVTCPLLDGDRGLCLVYADRPSACRSSGFYRTRAFDLWCPDVTDHLQRPGTEALVMGNQDALDRQLVRLAGPARPLSHWWRDEDPGALPTDGAHGQPTPF